jgi:WD40 repeat protein
MVFELPQDLYNKEEISTERDINLMKPVISIKSVGNVYDFCWYPLLNSMDADTCFFIATSQNEPIKMYDAFNGAYKCSYRAYDYADELESALSACFSSDGSLLFGGMRKGVVVFNTSVPGREYDTIELKKPVSCIAANYSNELAAGSWNKSISLIDTRDYLVTDTLQGHKQGITYLKYSANGEYLISGSRKDSNLLFWDMRNRSLPLYRFQRRVDTNQKIQFDISFNSNWLVSGDTRGLIHVWSLNDLDENAFPKENQYKLHNDAISGVSLHNYLPILATCSGQFKFGNDEESDEKEIIENSLVLWWVSKTEDNKENICAS